ncbi:MAG: Rieske 2Fe-2S domain-containing protein [Actinobacteria bacterium]|nr:Rieske 2Fe-2S domain-containing protein [Actinomycetota bacterium]
MGWEPAIAAEDLWEGELTTMTLGGQQVLLVNADGEIRAFEDRCPHLGSRLSEGDLDGCTLVCGKHLWEFDVLTGKGTNPGDSQLTLYECRVIDGTIEVLIP